MNFLFFCSLLSVAVFGGCASTSKKSVSTEARRTLSVSSETRQDQLILVATTDFHASLDRAEAIGKTIRNLRAQHQDRMVYLDAGDLFQGSLDGNLSKGRSIVDFYNLLTVDAAAIGNHELDYGVEAMDHIAPKPGEDGIGNLKARVKQAKFKWLSANLVYSKKKNSKPNSPQNALGQKTVFPPHAIFNRAGKKVCVVGATTPTTTFITNPMFVKSVQFVPLKEVLLAEAQLLRGQKNCDFVFLTIHAGLDCKADGSCLERSSNAEVLSLLEELPEKTFDAVVAGHTHLKAQEIIRGTPVLEAGAKGNFIGVVRLPLNPQSDEQPKFDPFIEVPKPPSGEHFSFPETADITEVLKPYRDVAEKLKQKYLGELHDDFSHKYQEEGALGNMIADALHETAKQTSGAHFALINSGGIRSELHKGRLTYGDVFSVLPFDNALSVIELSGSELKTVLSIMESGGHGIAPIAGLKIKKIAPKPGSIGSWTRDLNRDGKAEDWERQTIVEVTDSLGNPIEDLKMYRLATLDFLVFGGDHLSFVYNNVPPSRKHFFPGIWVRDILVDYLSKHPHVTAADYFDPAHPRVFLIP